MQDSNPRTFLPGTLGVGNTADADPGETPTVPGKTIQWLYFIDEVNPEPGKL